MNMASENSDKYCGGKIALVAIDSSEHSLRAFNWYLEHFHQENHIIGLAHIYTLPKRVSPMHGDPLKALDCQQHDEYVKEAEKDHVNLLQKYKNICAEKGIPSRDFCMEKKGSIGEAICNLAKDYNVCCIIMGQRGLGLIERTLFGSVSEYVLHNANTAVVIVPHEKK